MALIPAKSAYSSTASSLYVTAGPSPNYLLLSWEQIGSGSFSYQIENINALKTNKFIFSSN